MPAISIYLKADADKGGTVTTTTTHTPGPWSLFGTARRHMIDGDDGYGGSLVIADIENPNRDPRIEANARLIAAAPDLLAICQRFAVAEEPDGDDYAALYAAIAKARGS